MSMYQGKFDWSAALRPPTDVRGYVKEVIMNCIGVHAEVGDAVDQGWKKPAYIEFMPASGLY